MNNTIKLLICISITELTGAIGSIFTFPSIESWYTTLVRPELSPPNWVFGPVWTTLFVLMGIAAFLVWKKGLNRKDVRIALWVFVGQLILNMMWSIIFFNLQSPFWAFMDLIVLWLAIVSTMTLFSKISRPALWLLVPYILWVSFAGYLNYMIWILNR
jgi:tryptophan-rich sensory protein